MKCSINLNRKRKRDGALSGLKLLFISSSLESQGFFSYPVILPPCLPKDELLIFPVLARTVKKIDCVGILSQLLAL